MYTISNEEIRKWIEVSLKQRNNTHMFVSRDNEWDINVHIRDIQHKPVLWFELIGHVDKSPFLDLSFIKSDEKSGKLIIVKQGITLNNIRDDIKQKIKDVNKMYITELQMSILEQELIQRIPDKLYHATFRKRLASIRYEGLTVGKNKTHKISESDVIYLAINPYLARDFCKTSDNISECEFNSGIIVFEIDRFILSNKFLGIDRQNKLKDTVFTYREKIYPKDISVVKQTSSNLRIMGSIKDIKRVPTFK